MLMISHSEMVRPKGHIMTKEIRKKISDTLKNRGKGMAHIKSPDTTRGLKLRGDAQYRHFIIDNIEKGLSKKEIYKLFLDNVLSGKLVITAKESLSFFLFGSGMKQEKEDQNIGVNLGLLEIG